MQAEEFVRRHRGQVSPKEGWVTALGFVPFTVVYEVVARPVREAARAGLGFGGEIRSVASCYVTVGTSARLEQNCH